MRYKIEFTDGTETWAKGSMKETGDFMIVHEDGDVIEIHNKATIKSIYYDVQKTSVTIALNKETGVNT